MERLSLTITGLPHELSHPDASPLKQTVRFPSLKHLELRFHGHRSDRFDWSLRSIDLSMVTERVHICLFNNTFRGHLDVSFHFPHVQTIRATSPDDLWRALDVPSLRTLELVTISSGYSRKPLPQVRTLHLSRSTDIEIAPRDKRSPDPVRRYGLLW